MHTEFFPFAEKDLDPVGLMLHRRVLHTGIAVDVVRSFGTRRPHRHQCLEIVFVHAGTAIWSVGGLLHVLVPGDVVVFNADSTHSSRPVHGQYLRTGIHFLPELVPPHLLALLPGPHDPPWVVSVPERDAKLLYRKLYHLRIHSQEAPRDKKTQRLLTSVLSILSGRALAPNGGDALDREVLRAVVRYMASNLASEESLKELARRFYVSEGHLCHLFRKEFGCSPMKLWQIMKIEGICASPAIETCSVDELARRTGFATRRGFERAFRRVKGSTVTEYRSLLASG